MELKIGNIMRFYENVQITERTVEQAAETYVAVLECGESMWGHKWHPRYGRSDNVQFLMEGAFGKKEFNDAVENIFEKRRQSLKETWPELFPSR